MVEVFFMGGPKHGQNVRFEKVDKPPPSIVIPTSNWRGCKITGTTFTLYRIHAVRDHNGVRRWIATWGPGTFEQMLALGICTLEH